jgi:hypothetical protein
MASTGPFGKPLIRRNGFTLYAVVVTDPGMFREENIGYRIDGPAPFKSESFSLDRAEERLLDLTR